jgi:hypothetical protein
LYVFYRLISQIQAKSSILLVKILRPAKVGHGELFIDDSRAGGLSQPHTYDLAGGDDFLWVH